MFEIKHLKTLATLASTGNIRKASDALFVSQSALSHQLKDLEQRLNTPLFIRNTSPVQFTDKGEILLKLASDILPKVNNTLSELRAENNAVIELNLAIACHACFQWLLPITEQFSLQYPELKINFIEQNFFEKKYFTVTKKTASTIDVLFVDDQEENDSYIYHVLGTYEVVAVLPNESKPQVKVNTLNTPFLSAAEISQHVLLTYPVPPEELDIYKLFLNKENTYNVKSKYKPKMIKQVANSHMILQMVAANMGIAILPNWLVNNLSSQSLVQTKRVGEKGIYKTLYARYKAQSPQIELIEQLLPHTVSAFKKINNTKALR